MSAPQLRARDVISGEQGEAWGTIEGVRYCLMHLKNINSTVTYNKDEIGILGKRGKGHKKVGETYAGSMTVYYLTSIFREFAERYKKTGEDFYFDIQIVNNDTTSNAGEQIVTLIDCNFDSIDLAKLDVDSAHLEEDIDFTFEDWRLEKPFDVLDGLM